MKRSSRIIGMFILFGLSFLFFLFAIGPTRQAWQTGEFLSSLVSLLIGGTLFLLTIWLAIQVGMGRSRFRWALLRLAIATAIGFFGFLTGTQTALQVKLPIAILTVFFLLILFFLPENAAGSGKRMAGALFSISLAIIGLFIGVTVPTVPANSSQEALIWTLVFWGPLLSWEFFWIGLATGILHPARPNLRWLAGMLLLWISTFTTISYASLSVLTFVEVQKSQVPLAGVALILPLLFQILPFLSQSLAYFLLLAFRSSRLAPWLFLVNGIIGMVPPVVLFVPLPNFVADIQGIFGLLLFGATGVAAWPMWLSLLVRSAIRKA